MAGRLYFDFCYYLWFVKRCMCRVHRVLVVVFIVDRDSFKTTLEGLDIHIGRTNNVIYNNRAANSGIQSGGGAK